MAAAPTDGVELLERSLGHARVVLSEITEADLARPTRCPPWSVADLLDHVEDGLDAFTEAAEGRITLGSPPPAPVRVGRLADKACHLLGVWSAAPGGLVRVGDQRLPAGLLAGVAALEIGVHASDADRGRRFGPALPVAADDDAVTRLLAYLGRSDPADPTDPAGPDGKESPIAPPGGWPTA